MQKTSQSGPKFTDPAFEPVGKAEQTPVKAPLSGLYLTYLRKNLM